MQTSYKQQKIHTCRCTHGTRLFQYYYAKWNFVHHSYWLYINQETIKSQSIKKQTYFNTWEHDVQVNNKSIGSWYNKSKSISSMR